MEQKTQNNIAQYAYSSEITDTLEKIGKKYGLHIDQIGELDAEVRDILHGYSKSSDFIANAMERLEIDKDLAEKIAIEVNREIFEIIKSKMQSETQESRPDISAIERAGNFTIVRENGHEGDTKTGDIIRQQNTFTPPKIPVSPTPMSQQPQRPRPPIETMMKTSTNVNMSDTTENIETGEENGEDDTETSAETDGGYGTQNEEIGAQNTHTSSPPANLPGEEEVIGMTDEHTDPLVDHLLSRPTGTIGETIVRTEKPVAMPTAKTPAVPPQNPGGIDPYREPVQ